MPALAEAVKGQMAPEMKKDNACSFALKKLRSPHESLLLSCFIVSHKSTSPYSNNYSFVLSGSTVSDDGLSGSLVTSWYF